MLPLICHITHFKRRFIMAGLCHWLERPLNSGARMLARQRSTTAKEIL